MKNLLCLVLPVFLTATFLSAQVRPAGKRGHDKHSGVQYGTASYYANKFRGRPMAGGEPYDKNKMTCAHNSLPLGTWIKVTNIRNKRSVVVRVTDRLHHKNTRLVDLSGIAAAKLGYIKRGLARVKVEVLDKRHLPE
jgi:rare lipoprotein A